MIRQNTARWLKGVLWIGIYLVLVTAPLFVLYVRVLEPWIQLRTPYRVERKDWKGEKGMVTRDLLKRHLPELQEYFVCGPPPMMDAVETSLYRLKIPLGSVHSDRFNLV